MKATTWPMYNIRGTNLDSHYLLQIDGVKHGDYGKLDKILKGWKEYGYGTNYRKQYDVIVYSRYFSGQNEILAWGKTISELELIVQNFDGKVIKVYNKSKTVRKDEPQRAKAIKKGGVLGSTNKVSNGRISKRHLSK